MFIEWVSFVCTGHNCAFVLVKGVYLCVYITCCDKDISLTTCTCSNDGSYFFHIHVLVDVGNI